ncbi:MAG: tRNA preQ1(34) S-adenosylmethionine ribosyltransferase-isomerase QueA [Rhodocyclaceae bacterium]
MSTPADGLTLDEFDYDLPPHLIAQVPLPDRSAGRLLTLDNAGLADRWFRDLPTLLRAGDLLVFNDTRVLHARLTGVRASGGKVEVLIERQTGPHQALAQVRASHSPKAGSTLLLDGALEVEVLGREGEFFFLRFPGEEDLVSLLERHGKVPLPPYIERAATPEDHARYQTVFAREPGSVAAPTAGLHFDEPLLAALAAQGVDFAYVTLHVGAGTFQPVRVNNLAEHRMHRERYRIPEATVEAIAAARQRGGRVVAVGTTSLRALEAAAAAGPFGSASGEAELFILPGFEFRIADCLITNFHLPRSTLLMLVSAFAGLEETRAAYRHALANQYRFFSYGDAMFITRKA